MRYCQYCNRAAQFAFRAVYIEGKNMRESNYARCKTHQDVQLEAKLRKLEELLHLDENTAEAIKTQNFGKEVQARSARQFRGL